MKKRSKKNKSKKKSLIILSLICVLSGVLCILSYFYLTIFAVPKEIIINYIGYEDDIVEIEIQNTKENDSYCAIEEKDIKEEDIKWEKIENNTCNYEIKDAGSYILYIKN